MSFGDYVAKIFDWNLSKEQKDGFNREYEDALNANIPQRNPEIFRKNGKSWLSTWHMVMRNYYLTYDTLTESPDGGIDMCITCKKNDRDKYKDTEIGQEWDFCERCLNNMTNAYKEI